LAIPGRIAEVVDDAPMSAIVMHKLPSVCISVGQQRAVQSSRRTIACKQLVPLHIAITIMCPKERDCLERYTRLQRHPVSESVST